MEIDLSYRTNNVRVIKHYNLKLFVLSIEKVWEFYKKSEFHTYCDSILMYSQNYPYKS